MKAIVILLVFLSVCFSQDVHFNDNAIGYGLNRSKGDFFPNSTLFVNNSEDTVSIDSIVFESIRVTNADCQSVNYKSLLIDVAPLFDKRINEEKRVTYPKPDHSRIMPHSSIPVRFFECTNNLNWSRDQYYFYRYQYTVNLSVHTSKGIIPFDVSGWYVNK